MATHTPTPWRPAPEPVRPGDYHRVIGSDRSGKPRTVASMYFRVKADAERTVQCVNACSGMDDPGAALATAREVLRTALYTYTLINNMRGIGVEVPADTIDAVRAAILALGVSRE